ncbi:pyridoxine/pyridoxamine 5'-phosphate oxidase [Silvibacterium bohemicum]|uniref:Pyridoxine/pyridoxamine 5'-phosphate oxidase n=1 Tax=Silvibacterium bohemicum TaxID=1577686 RepID=A0A841K1T4_9BACT|nr:pyridoxamine 5'-phosphate oxidase family protein [Silvibacterium bohemicum]MBB6145909.1 pyridoxine/pyridoxamine 5'-phosphate oxidase [Silvibacterium bohemicum]
MLDRAEVYNFIRSRKLAVVSSLGPQGEPQSALVGIAVSPDLEIVFDTVKTSRKYPNLKADPRISAVIGWEEEQTLQYEGLAMEPDGEDLVRAKEIYFGAWPDGKERQLWPGIAYFRVRPRWLRYSDFAAGRIEEIFF